MPKKSIEEKVFKYVNLAKQCEYVAPVVNDVSEFTEDDILFASTNQSINNEVFIMAQIITLKRYPLLYPIFKSMLKTYIDKFKKK